MTGCLPLSYLLFFSINANAVSFTIHEYGKPSFAVCLDLCFGNDYFPTFQKYFFQRLFYILTVEMDKHSMR